MDEELENQPKILLAEALIVGPLFFIIPDLIELTLLFFGLDDFWLSDMYSFATSQIYLRLKGIKTTYTLITNVLEMIPYVGALPLRTIGFIITYYIVNKNINLGPAEKLVK